MARDEQGRFTSAGVPFVTTTVSNRQIFDKLEEVARKVDPLPGMVADHERRIDKLESKRIRAQGAYAMIVPTLTAIGGILGMWAILR